MSLTATVFDNHQKLSHSKFFVNFFSFSVCILIQGKKTFSEKAFEKKSFLHAELSEWEIFCVCGVGKSVGFALIAL